MCELQNNFLDFSCFERNMFLETILKNIVNTHNAISLILDLTVFGEISVSNKSVKNLKVYHSNLTFYTLFTYRLIPHRTSHPTVSMSAVRLHVCN